MNKFRIVITSVPYREKLIAEIWLEELHVAEINKDGDYPEIELFPSEKIKVPLKDLQEVLDNAIKQLST